MLVNDKFLFFINLFFLGMNLGFIYLRTSTLLTFFGILLHSGFAGYYFGKLK